MAWDATNFEAVDDIVFRICSTLRGGGGGVTDVAPLAAVRVATVTPGLIYIDVEVLRLSFFFLLFFVGNMSKTEDTSVCSA